MTLILLGSGFGFGQPPVDPFDKENELKQPISAPADPSPLDPFSKENELKLPAEARPAPTPPSTLPVRENPPPTKNKRFLQAVPTASAAITPATARRGETVTWSLTLNLASGWHTYPTQQEDRAVEASRTTFVFPEKGSVVFVGPLISPPFLTATIPGLGEGGAPARQRYYEGKVVWQRKMVVRPQAEPGTTKVPVEVTVLCCDAQGCLLPEKLVFEAPLTISAEPPVAVEAQYRDEVSAAGTGPPAHQHTAGTSPAARQGSEAGADLLSFILAGIFWGAVSLLTPCVFPMIPITVSFFLKQSEKEHHRPLGMAVVYSSTIVVVLTLGAVLLLGVFQAASQHWLTNLILGGLFVFFALSLFGMYEITLPSGLARFTSTRQDRGGTVGTIFMALTFSIISFSCVAPFMGGFAALVPSFGNVTDMVRAGDIGRLLRIFATLLLGALGFSVTFASPFFFLALFPSLLRQMPRSGSWMNTIKVVMGFLELAAAVKFLRATELLAFGQAQVLTYDLALGSYVALSLLCAVYLLGVFRLPHDEPPEHLGVPRMIVSALFLSLALYLLPGLFKADGDRKQRPTGSVFAWLDSFLLPDLVEQRLGSLPEALQLAQQRHKLVFLDFTGLS